MVLAHAQGYTVSEIDIELFPRRAGVAKYSGRSRVLVGVGDLVVVWFYLKFSEKPMQFFGGGGLDADRAGAAGGAGDASCCAWGTGCRRSASGRC